MGQHLITVESGKRARVQRMRRTIPPGQPPSSRLFPQARTSPSPDNQLVILTAENVPVICVLLVHGNAADNRRKGKRSCISINFFLKASQGVCQLRDGYYNIHLVLSSSLRHINQFIESDRYLAFTIIILFVREVMLTKVRS